MTNRWLLFAVLLIGVGALAFVTLTGDGPRSGSRVAASPATEIQAARRTPDSIEPAELSAEAVPVETAPVESSALAAREAEPQRRTASTDHEDELEEAVWVEGRVVFPVGTPLEEEVFVLGKGKDFEHGPLHRARVANDGTFRVAFSKETVRGRLELQASFLYLAKKPSVLMRKSHEPLLLEPELGALIKGRIALPAEAPLTAEDLGKLKTSLQGRLGSRAELRRGTARFGEVRDDLTFELAGVPVAYEYELSCDPGKLESVRLHGLVLEAGETREVVLEPGLGVRLAGRVVDDAGDPVADARLQARSETGGIWSASWLRRATTAEDGAFELSGLSPGSVTVTATHKGLEPAELRLGALESGTLHGDLEFVLAQGMGIAGRVQWSDGTPVADAGIQLERVSPEKTPFRSGADRWQADEEGLFEITGLGEGPFRLLARGVRSETVTVISRITGRERTKKKKISFRAVVENVEPGTSDLVVTLSEDLNLVGRVVDDRGEPVGRFRIFGELRTLTENRGWDTEDRTAQSFEDERGRFELEGLTVGHWRFRAGAKGYGESEWIELQVPDELETLEILLPRNGTVTGIVLDPAGIAVSDARISVRRQASPFGSPAFGSEESDREGLFRIEELPTREVFVRAAKAPHAPSAWTKVETNPGNEITGLELRLRLGAGITGQVLGLDGEPVANTAVQVRNWEEAVDERVQTDARGRFEFNALPGGSYRLEAEATARELSVIRGDGPSAGAQTLIERAETVELQEGETVDVVLRPPELEPVRLVGRVHIGKEPGEGLYLWANVVEGDAPYARCSTEDDGAYALLLPRPGTYDVYVSSVTSGLRVRNRVVVPDTQELEHDFRLAVGRIAGRVLDPTGKGAAGLLVKAADEQGSGSQGQATTDTEGRYSIDPIPSGTYTVRAGGYDGDWEKRQHGNPFGESRVIGVGVGPGQSVQGIDLHLREAGVLEGIVRGAGGGPVAGVSIVLRSADGGRSRRRPLKTEADGTFTYPGLAAGEYELRTASDDVAMRGRERAMVRTGETTSVVLRVEPATQVTIRVVDAAGNPVARHPQIADAEGNGTDVLAQDEKGLYRSRGVLPGVYTVAVKDGTRAAEESLEVGTAGSYEVVLRVE